MKFLCENKKVKIFSAFVELKMLSLVIIVVISFLFFRRSMHMIC